MTVTNPYGSVPKGMDPRVYGWDTQFLHDINAPVNQANLNYLGAWTNREGGWPDKAFWNPLRTTQREPGSFSVNSVGVQGYQSLASGAQANATAIENGLYGDILSALRAGNPNINQTYPSLGKWSGGGYTSLAGQNPLVSLAGLENIGTQPQQDILGQQNYLAGGQLATNQALAGADISYANREAQLQRELLGLSGQQLQNQRLTLERQMALDPKLYMLQQAQLQDQMRLAVEQGHENIRQTRSQEAGSGSLFTKGGENRLQLARDQFNEQYRALGYAKAGDKLRFDEQMAALKDQMKNIDITAERYGISREELAARLENQLANISSGTQLNDLGILSGMLSNSAQIYGLQQYAPPVTPLYNAAGIPGQSPAAGLPGQTPGYPQ